MNISTTLPPDVLAALAPAVAAVEAEARAATVDTMYAVVAKAGKVTVRSMGSQYRAGSVTIIGQAFPDRQQAFADELYGRPVNLSNPDFAPDATDDEDEDEETECEEHCSSCGCCQECDGRHDGEDWGTLIGPNGDERCPDCDHWCNDR